MEFPAKIFLLLLYPAVMGLRLLSRILGRDPLRLKEPSDDSLWIVRGEEHDSAHYFLEASDLEGKDSGGVAGPLIGLLRAVSILFKPCPPNGHPGAEHRTPDRDQDIPDEVYTLW
jgi:hypothetical protein